MLHTIPVPTVRIQKPTATPESVLAPIQGQLHPTARKVFTQIFETALRALSASGHTVTPNQHVIHQPVEILAAALGMSRVTLYTHLKTLKRLGVLDFRGHTGTWYGLSRKTGTLFAVSLTPAAAPARLRWFDLKHKHRDLQADTQSGTRTAWAFLKTVQSRPDRAERCKNALGAWAVKPGHTSNVVKSSDCQGDLHSIVYSLETLSSTHKNKRAEMINRYALALSTGFLDSTNLNFWRKLLWDALRRDWEGLDTLYQLQSALTRLMADVQEVECLRSGGALLVSRLKACGLWNTLKYA